jgi:hypothetical protein
MALLEGRRALQVGGLLVPNYNDLVTSFTYGSGGIPIFPAFMVLIFAGHNHQPQSAVRRSEFESGPVRQASYKCREMIRRSVTYRACSAAEYAAFQNWRSKILAHGADHFLWTDPLRVNAGVSPSTVRAVIVDGSTTGDPSNDRLDTWEISFTIEYWSDIGF